MKVTVTNTGRHPTEAAGRVFPARATVERDIDPPERIHEIRDHPRLVIVASDDGLDELSVDELKEAAKARDLAVSGTKGELLARIREHDSAQGEPESDEDQQGEAAGGGEGEGEA